MGVNVLDVYGGVHRELRVIILSRKLGLRNLQYIPAGPLRGVVSKRVLYGSRTQILRMFFFALRSS